MADGALEEIISRNHFYQDNYRRVVLLFVLSVTVNIVLFLVTYYVYMNPPAPRYFPTSINGRITPLIPVDQPNQSDAAILQWVNSAAIAAYTYNFVDYRNQLQAASLFFTNSGWENFLLSLKQSNTLDAVTTRKLVVSAVATKPPVILNKGLVQGGNYAWRVQMSIVATLQNSDTFTQQNYQITMLILRVSTLNNPRGIGIDQFVVQQLDSNLPTNIS